MKLYSFIFLIITAHLFAEENGIILPAENVRLYDVEGRGIVATVLSKDANGIKIRIGDKEQEIAWNKLSDVSVNKIRGVEKTRLQIVRERMAKDPFKGKPHNEFVDHLEELRGYVTELSKLPKKELNEKFIKNDDPMIQALTANFYRNWDKLEVFESGRDPNWKENNLNYFDIIKDLEIKDPNVDEKVSLRPKFEELGVKAQQQEGALCTLYSAQHLAQYAYLSAGLKPPSIEELKAKLRPIHKWEETGGATPPIFIIRALNNFGKKPKVLWLKVPASMPAEELAKHQLRNGRAVSVGTFQTDHNGRTDRHQVIVVGFEVKAGKTTWEILNSNQIYKDAGYQTRSEQELRIGGNEDFSFWFE